MLTSSHGPILLNILIIKYRGSAWARQVKRPPSLLASVLIIVMTTIAGPHFTHQTEKSCRDRRPGDRPVVKGRSYIHSSLTSAVIAACRLVRPRLQAFADMGWGDMVPWDLCPIIFHSTAASENVHFLEGRECFCKVCLENILLV